MTKNIFRIISFVLMTVVSCAFLSACSPLSDSDKTSESLEAAGYSVIYNTGEGEANAAALPQGAKATILAYNGNEFINITYYEDAETAEEAWDAVLQSTQEIQKNYEDFVCEKSGSVIYYGTEQALKDAKN